MKPNTQECVRARPFGGCWPPVRQTSLKSPCGVLSPSRLAAFGRTVADVLCPSASSKDQFRLRARPARHKPAERKSIAKIISHFRDPQWTKIAESKPLVSCQTQCDQCSRIHSFPSGGMRLVALSCSQRGRGHRQGQGDSPLPQGGRSHLLLERASPYLHALAPARCGSDHAHSEQLNATMCHQGTVLVAFTLTSHQSKPLRRPGVCDADFVRTVIQRHSGSPTRTRGLSPPGCNGLVGCAAHQPN